MAHPVGMTTRQHIAHLLARVVNQQPATVTLMRTYRILERSGRRLDNNFLLLAWADLNDLVLSFRGYLPYEVYSKVFETYGTDAARVMIEFDNQFLRGPIPTPRAGPLLESVNTLREALRGETEEESMSLGLFLRWCCENAPKLAGGPAEFQDPEILTRWAARFLGGMYEAEVPGNAAQGVPTNGTGDSSMTLAGRSSKRQRGPTPQPQQRAPTPIIVAPRASQQASSDIASAQLQPLTHLQAQVHQTPMEQHEQLIDTAQLISPDTADGVYSVGVVGAMESNFI